MKYAEKVCFKIGLCKKKYQAAFNMLWQNQTVKDLMKMTDMKSQDEFNLTTITLQTKLEKCTYWTAGVNSGSKQVFINRQFVLDVSFMKTD